MLMIVLFIEFSKIVVLLSQLVIRIWREGFERYDLEFHWLIFVDSWSSNYVHQQSKIFYREDAWGFRSTKKLVHCYFNLITSFNLMESFKVHDYFVQTKKKIINWMRSVLLKRKNSTMWFDTVVLSWDTRRTSTITSKRRIRAIKWTGKVVPLCSFVCGKVPHPLKELGGIFQQDCEPYKKIGENLVYQLNFLQNDSRTQTIVKKITACWNSIRQLQYSVKSLFGIICLKGNLIIPVPFDSCSNSTLC